MDRGVEERLWDREKNMREAGSFVMDGSQCGIVME